MNKNLPIGIFDSGLGGLTVLKALQKKLPNESFVYIGDTAHVPYGNKSKASIIHYTTTLSTFLINTYNVKMIIVACNTASALAITTLQSTFPIPILDVINPLGRLLSEHQTLQRIGIIGTHNTIQSKSYNKLLLKINPELKISSQACPLFVPIIEEGLEKHPVAALMIDEYLSPLIKNNIEALILGCTHYPILKKVIHNLIPREVKIIDSSDILSLYVKEYLTLHKLINIHSNIATKLLVTDASNHFNQFASKILNNNFCSISTIQPF